MAHKTTYQLERELAVLWKLVATHTSDEQWVSIKTEFDAGQQKTTVGPEPYHMYPVGQDPRLGPVSQKDTPEPMITAGLTAREMLKIADPILHPPGTAPAPVSQGGITGEMMAATAHAYYGTTAITCDQFDDMAKFANGFWSDKVRQLTEEIERDMRGLTEYLVQYRSVAQTSRRRLIGIRKKLTAINSTNKITE